MYMWLEQSANVLLFRWRDVCVRLPHAQLPEQGQREAPVASLVLVLLLAGFLPETAREDGAWVGFPTTPYNTYELCNQ